MEGTGIWDVLACPVPSCAGPLEAGLDGDLRCGGCGAAFAVVDGVPRLLDPSSRQQAFYDQDEMFEAYVEMNLASFRTDLAMAPALSPDPSVAEVGSWLKAHEDLTGPFYRDVADQIVGWSGPGDPEAVVIDVGCGMGRLAAELLDGDPPRWAGRYLGVDLSSRLVDEAQRAFVGGATDASFPAEDGYSVPRRLPIDPPRFDPARCGFAVGDATRLPVRTGSADVVVSLNLVDRLPGRDAPWDVVDLLWRAVKPGGLLFLADPFHWLDDVAADPPYRSFEVFADRYADGECVALDDLNFTVRRRASRRVVSYEDQILVLRKLRPVDHPRLGRYHQLSGSMSEVGYRPLAGDPQGRFGWNMPADPPTSWAIRASAALRVLEVGSGDGGSFTLEALRQPVEELVSLDVQPELRAHLLEQADEAGLSRRLHVVVPPEGPSGEPWWSDAAGVEAVAAMVGEVDLVVARQSLQFGTTDALVNALSMFEQVLRPGGRVWMHNMSPFLAYLFEIESDLEGNPAPPGSIIEALLEADAAYASGTSDQGGSALLLPLVPWLRGQFDSFLWFNDDLLAGALRRAGSLTLVDSFTFSPPRIWSRNKLLAGPESWQEREMHVAWLRKPT